MPLGPSRLQEARGGPAFTSKDGALSNLRSCGCWCRPGSGRTGRRATVGPPLGTLE